MQGANLRGHSLLKVQGHCPALRARISLILYSRSLAGFTLNRKILGSWKWQVVEHRGD